MSTRLAQVGAEPLSVNVAGRKYLLGLPPSPQQNVFLKAREREQLYGGAKRGGKSWAICLKLLLLAVQFPGNLLRLFRQDLTDLRESTLVTWERVVPAELILDHHKTHRNYVIRTNGKPSVLHYDGMSELDPRDQGVQGWEHGAFAIDEPSEIDPENYRMLLAQLCWVLPDGTRPPYMAILGSNPEPGWLHDRFGGLIEPTEDDPELKVNTNGKQIFVKALPIDNPYLPPNWEEDQELDAPKEWVTKYLKGSWRVSTGQVFKEWDDDTHLIDMPSREYLRTLRLVGALDHADTGTAALLIVGIDPDENVVALYEYYERLGTLGLISRHAQGMKDLLDRCVTELELKGIVNSAYRLPEIHPSYYALEYLLIDPSTQAKVLQGRNELYSRMDEFRRNGLPAVPAYNALEAGINLVKEYVHVKPLHIHPFKTQKEVDGRSAVLRGAPSLFVVGRNCPNLRKNIIGLRQTVSDRGTIKYVGEDHALDCLRYIFLSRPEPPQRTQRDTLSMTTQEQFLLRTHEAWSRKFGHSPADENSWFGDSRSASPKTWFGEKIN